MGGVIKQLDRHGRLLLPGSVRKHLGLEPGTPLEFFIDTGDGEIILRAYRRGCEFCGKIEGLVQVGASRICRQCARQIAAD